MGQTRSKWRAGQLAFYDSSTYETVLPVAPVVFYDDFLGTVINADLWTTASAGAGTAAIAASVLTLTQNVAGATDENGVYTKDDKAFNLDKGPIFETRMAISTAPTIGSEVVFGLFNDSFTTGAGRILVASELLIYAAFGFYTTVGAGLIPVIRTDDGTTNSGVVSTAITAVNLNAYHVYRIDFTNVADVKFYIDGVGVATATTFDMSAGAAVMTQPMLMAQKVGVDAGLGVALFDYVKVWQATR
jgi:hypothetical protein